MKVHILWPFAFGFVLLLGMNSCTKTIVQTNTVVDTLHSVDTVGLAYIRFICMFPDTMTTSLRISKTSNANTLFATATQSVPGGYIPVRPDTSYTYFFSTTDNLWMDSEALPAPGLTMTTYALFLSGNRILISPTIDSEQWTPPPSGYCYVRFLEGIAGSPAQFFLDLDTIGHSLFYRSNGHSKSITYPDFSSYVLVKAGEHTLFLRDPLTLETYAQIPGNFQDGSYYTVIATGTSGTDAKLMPDLEH